MEVNDGETIRDESDFLIADVQKVPGGRKKQST